MENKIQAKSHHQHQNKFSTTTTAILICLLPFYRKIIYMMNAYILQLTLLQSYLQHSKGRHWKPYISSFHKINVQLCVETNMKKNIN